MAKLKVLTPEFRLSFFDLFEAKVSTMDDEEGGGNKRPRFGIEMLFPKTIKMTELAEMKKVFNSEVKPSWITDAVEYRKFEQCFINGDKKKQESRKGHWILRAHSGEDYPPRVLLPNRDIASKKDIYSGCYGRAILTAFPWEFTKKGKLVKAGVSFNLLTFQKTRKGERLGGGPTEAEQDALLDAAPIAEEEAEDLLA